jgi:phosphoribosylamine-glycine ligase
VPEHVLFVGREEGLARRYRRFSSDVSVSVLCRMEHLPQIRFSGDCSRVLALPAEADLEEWVAMAQALHAFHHVSRIALFGEQDIDRTAAIGEALGISTHSRDTVRWVQDKCAMRARLRAVRLEDTSAAIVADRDMLHSFAAESGLPLVVKPNGGTASVGISVAMTEADLDASFARANAEHEGFRSRGVLAERFFEGPQFSIEGFSENGEHVFVAITRKYSDPVTLVELGHVMPAPLSDAERQVIEHYAADILDALGVRFGPSHTEFVLTAEGPRIIETHLRVGDMYSLLPGSTGIDLVEMQIRQTLGERVLPEIRRMQNERSQQSRYGALWYANSDLRGELVKIVGIGDSSSKSDITVKPLVEPGEKLDGLRSNYSRLAEARAFAPEPSQALTMVKEAIKGLRIVVHASPVELDCF